MKRTLLVALLLICLVPLDSVGQTPQSTAFTYQGRLSANGQPANGNFDLTFKLFDAAAVGTGTQIGSTISMAQFPVANGVFTTDLDFPGVFNGKQLWLEVTVGTQTLSPRQPVNTVPVAQYALTSVVPTVFMSSSANVTVTTDSSGAPAQYGVMPLSGYTDTAFSATSPCCGVIDLTPYGSSPPPQILANNGTIGSIRATFWLKQSLNLVGTTVIVSAQVYTSPFGSAVVTPLPGTNCVFSPPLTGFESAGIQATCTVTGLSMPYSAGNAGVIAISATATGAMLANSIQASVAVTVGP